MEFDAKKVKEELVYGLKTGSKKTVTAAKAFSEFPAAKTAP